jgi:hypothetical protein
LKKYYFFSRLVLSIERRLLKNKPFLPFINQRGVPMKRFLIVICLIMTYIVSIIPSSTQRFYSLKVRIPQHLSHIANDYLSAYYKGFSISLDDGWAQLPECGQPCTFSLLITEDVDFKTRGNTIRYLKRIDGQEFLWYDLTLSICPSKDDHEKQSYSWKIEEREDAPERIPEHAIVLLANPSHIADLQPEPSLPGTTDVALPVITFKEEINAEEFKDSLIAIRLGAALNLDAIHRQDKPSCFQRHPTVLTASAVAKSVP